jgi:Ohr subfamily peroxiredoxin
MSAAVCAYFIAMAQKRSTEGDVPYRTEVTAIGGRDGFAQSADRRLRLELCGERGSERAKGTDPEQLLAAAYASCFLSAIRQAGREAGVEVAADANVTARVELDTEPDAELDQADAAPDEPGLRVSLIVDLPGLDPAQRQALVERAHAISRCSRALRRSVAVRTVVD